MWEVDHDPVVGDLAVDHLPEVHVAYLDALPGGGDAHELASVPGWQFNWNESLPTEN